MSYIKQEHSDYYMDPKNFPSDGNQGDHNQSSTQSSQSSITAFLAKLWALVNDPSCDDLITWDPSGASFHVYDQSRFAREILPRYFKHNNFASFIRQLNMYGFRKMSTIEQGSLKNERDDIEFAHPHFIRGQDSLLESIKRRAPDNQQKSNLQGGSYIDPKTGQPIELSHILDNVRTLQTKQTSLNDKLSYMQTENQALWGEIASLRQKHSKQQQIVSKLMEFLLNFITSNSAHNHAQSFDQQPHKEGITAAPHHPQQTQAQHHTVNEQDLTPNTLKRKHAALTHNDEPNKRTTAQQQQQQQQFSHPPGLGRQQSVTINELTDNDGGAWLHGDTAPLVDLVPSPAPAQTTDDNYLQQQQRNDYRWPASTNESKQNPAFLTVGNGDNVANPYVPDFILRTDDPNGTQIDGANLTGMKTSHANTDNLKTSPTLYSQNQHQHKIGQSSGQPSFSLDDITGDVDHIQSSLDNIREFMFDNLPDEPSIDDLFGEDNGFLSPLLQTTSADNPMANLVQDQKLIPGDSKSDQLESTKGSQAVPNVNDQLLEHLITETALVEEQRHTIDQLEREKSDLQNKIDLLEQQTTKKH